MGKKKEGQRIQAKKKSSLFSTTGLDPKVEVRRRAKRRAHKVAKRCRKKKRGSSSLDVKCLAVVKNLRELLLRHGMWDIGETSVCFEDFFKKYLSVTTNWQAICDSFPQEVGCLELERFCRLGTLECVTRFEKFSLGLEVHQAPQGYGGKGWVA